MNEIKYGPLYGLQKPFDNGPADSMAYGLFHDEYIYNKIDKTSVYFFDIDNQWSRIDDGAPIIPFLAMRRIIRIIAEPKCWTLEDKKAGRLPDVGAKCRHGRKEETVIAVTENFVVTECLDGAVCTTRKCEFMASYNPVETPEEKAARLREEWIQKSCYDLVHPTEKAKQLAGLIYDALLSGELSMPSNDGE